METPREEPAGKKPKLSECSPLFMSVRSQPCDTFTSGGSEITLTRADIGGAYSPGAFLSHRSHFVPPCWIKQAYELRGAGAVLHSHALESLMVRSAPEL